MTVSSQRAIGEGMAWLQELRTLGKGGYGLVVAAVNRLDGRQYAVKKIRMPSCRACGILQAHA